MTIGFAVGVGSSVVVTRRVRRAAQRFTPPAVVGRVGERASNLGRGVHAAVTEGRDAMRLREQELQAEVGRRSK
jgi:hypothetical protein